MDTLRVLIGCAALIFIALCVGAFFLGMRKGFTKQGRADIRRRSADRGLVTCEDVHEEMVYGDYRNQINDDRIKVKCTKTAIYVTPNGYFCGEHADENSGKGALRSKHMLNFELKKYDPNWKAS